MAPIGGKPAQAILAAMYAQFFGLTQEPFSIAPDPRYLYMSERHREALAHLLYGVGGGGGFVLLSGEIGAGKTTVCRCFLEQVPPRCNVAYIFNPKLTVIELLQSICDEFRIPAALLVARQAGSAATVKDYLDPLNEFLLRTHAVGQNNLLIIDEAQNLSADVLEQLRLLTNLETNERKLLQIILIGQPELRNLLARPELEQLAQRVVARFHLDALSDVEADHYIRHRLAVAGLHGPLPFDAGAMRRIHRLARGVPRRINLLCDRALLGAYATGRRVVDRAIVDRAAREVFGSLETTDPATRVSRRTAVLVGTVLAGASVLGASLLGAARWTARGPNAVLRTAAGAPAASRALAAVAQPPGAMSTTAASTPGAASHPALAPAGRASDPPPVVLTASDLTTAAPSAWHDERDAWRRLALAWKLSPAGDPCQPADALSPPQVQCYRSTGSTLALIRQLDRPGLLTLRDVDGRPVYAVLTGLSERSATLRIGDARRTVTLGSLATLWRGDFSTFWRTPPDYAGGVVGPGSGPAGDWLVAQLARLQPGTGPAMKASGADQAFKTRVSDFQLAQGLKPDGRAGPTTFMQLNRAIGIEEPHLLADPAPTSRSGPAAPN